MSYASYIRAWREDPRKFVWDTFKVTPDRWQEDALMAFASNDPAKKRIALRACAGPGKTACEAWIGLNFLTCYGDRDNHPKGACLSITADNLRDNLWTEFANWIARSQFLDASFTLTATRLFSKDHPKDWFLSARSFARSANTEEIARALAGIHAKDVLYLIDESGDIPTAVLRAAEQGIGPAERFGKIVQAGNPTSTSGMLYAAATTLSHEWFNIRITSDPLDPNRTPRVPIEFAQSQIDNYGRDNPWVKAYFLGEFPESGINTLLSIEEVETAMARNIHESQYDFLQKRLGVDVARFGLDSTVIFPRWGLQAFKPQTMHGARTNEIGTKIMQAQTNWGGEQVMIDDTGGYGAGVVDFMIQNQFHPTPINFSSSSPDAKFFNMRSYMWFTMAEWIKRGGGLPYDEQLKKELTAPTYSFTQGKFRLEEKEQIKKRLGFSTDKSDALCLTFALPDLPSQLHLPKEFRTKGKVKSAYDVFNRK